MIEIILVAVVVVLVAALFVVSFLKRKKYNEEMGQIRSELKENDKVMTDTGVVGFVVESFEEEESKFVVLKTGRGNNIGYITVHANAIYYVFDKEKEKVESAKTVIAVKKPMAKAETDKATTVAKSTTTKKPVAKKSSK